MPTNVPPEYVVAEREYQKASTLAEKLKCLEKMLSACPTHKGAETLRAEIKTKISRLKEKLLKEKEKKKSAFSLAVKKEGAAQIVLVGPPNTGKTSLLNTLTGASYETAPYPHTTTKPNLGILDYQAVKLQLVDLPPLIEGAALKQAPYFAIIRNADLVLLVIDRPSQLPPLLKEFSESHFLLNKVKPPIRLKKELGGGFTFIGEKLVQGSLEQVKRILLAHNLAHATIEIFDRVTPADFEEVLEEGLAYRPALVALNKQDEGGEVTKQDRFEVIPLSARKKINLELLKEKIWQRLNLLRIYTKEPGKKPSFKEPLTLKKGSSLKDLAQYIHKDFLKKFKYAKVWGSSAKHPGQTVGSEHRLADNDVVEVHLR